MSSHLKSVFVVFLVFHEVICFCVSDLTTTIVIMTLVIQMKIIQKMRRFCLKKLEIDIQKTQTVKYVALKVVIIHECWCF
jgi:hypothetical protein